MSHRCPSCTSPAPHLHPAVQCGGEVSLCPDAFHERVTPENTPAKIAETQALLSKFRVAGAILEAEKGDPNEG